ncbi:MAG: acyl-CoA dehydrogenase family protein, partial [Rhodospirillales bacterium]|nr:acyl-CoA dehydrogenase family protein [Rhodospirillales bacterium]
MNFEFSDDLLQLRETARRYLAARGTIREARRVLEGAQTHDAALWQGLAKMGWIGAAIPE